MKLKVDKGADALYLRLDDSPVVESEEVSPGVVLDYNESNEVVWRGDASSLPHDASAVAEPLQRRDRPRGRHPFVHGFTASLALFVPVGVKRATRAGLRVIARVDAPWRTEMSIRDSLASSYRTIAIRLPHDADRGRRRRPILGLRCPFARLFCKRGLGPIMAIPSACPCNGEIGPVGGTPFVHGFTASLALFVPVGEGGEG